MGRIGFGEMLVLAFIFVMLFGAKKLPEVGAAIGSAIKEFKKASKDVEGSIKDAIEDKK